MPGDLASELMDYLTEATLVCPSYGKDDIILLQLGPNMFIPACCDMKDFNRIFKNQSPLILEFKEILTYLNNDLDGIILNPGSVGFIINPAFTKIISTKIKNKQTSGLKGYDVKVRLDDFRPLTWRDLIIPAGITFKDLDNILKILWDFLGYHLSRFTFKNSSDVITNDFEGIDFNPDELDCAETVIDDYFENSGKIYWEYDYGDGWSFTIEVKKTLDYDKPYPTIKRFKGDYNPQDDIGGVWGLKRLMYEDQGQLTKFNPENIQEELKNFKDYNPFD